METAVVADPVFYFTPLVLPGGYPENLFATEPKPGFATTGRAIAMGIDGLGEPNPVLKTECLICQGAHGAYIYYITNKLTV